MRTLLRGSAETMITHLRSFFDAYSLKRRPSGLRMGDSATDRHARSLDDAASSCRLQLTAKYIRLDLCFCYKNGAETLFSNCAHVSTLQTYLHYQKMRREGQRRYCARTLPQFHRHGLLQAMTFRSKNEDRDTMIQAERLYEASISPLTAAHGEFYWNGAVFRLYGFC